MPWQLLSVVILALALVGSEAQQGSNRPPYFLPQPYVAEISEGASTGTYVATVTAVDPENDDITYSIPSTAIGSDVFQINSTGDISVKGTLDRETTSSYQLTIEVEDTTFRLNPPSRTLFIVIQDINDETPSFLLGDSMLNILETASGTIETYYAEDGDEGLSGEVEYSITPTNSPFSIDANNGDLSVSGSLDYDSGSRQYTVTVAASDRGTSPNTGYLQVTITISDADDLPPDFTLDTYDAEIRENATNRTEVQTVVATDQDTGINNDILYDIIEVTDADSMVVSIDTFVINEDSGVIYTNAALDHEISNRYTIIVKATENSTLSRTATASVVVSVLDLNDNPPVFEQKRYNESVDETTSLNVAILTVRATDLDGTEHNAFEYEITTAAAQEFFTIDSNGNIKLIKKLDYESNQMHTFEVRAKETVGARVLNGTTIVDIYVNNENDEAPMFENKNNYNPMIKEEVDPGTPVYTVSSRDRDAAPFTNRTYSIVANSSSSNIFDIDPDTGLISVKNSSSAADELDYDTGSNTFALFVEVSDGVQSDFALVNIALLPINDNPPVIAGDMLTMHIMEGVVGQVGTIMATDGDTNPQDSTLLWCITGGDEDGEFVLMNYNGSFTTTLSTASQLNFEAKSVYVLTIQVTDGVECEGNTTAGYFKDIVRVTVNVMDVNDNPPVFTNATYYFDIDEEGGAGDKVGTVSVNDEDSSAIITYSTESTLFAIDNETGDITTRSNIDREDYGDSSPYNITFIVTAEDRHNSSTTVQTATANVVVRLFDINDNIPVFDETGFQRVEFREHNQTVTFTFSATDEDAGSNAELTYNIIAGNIGDVFKLTPVLGGPGVRLGNDGLDRENISSYDLVIEAEDGGGNSSNATIHVIVLDINDIRPSFMPTTIYTDEIPESSFPGSFVVNVTAVDTDDGANADLHYFFMSGGNTVPTVSPFRINENTGVVTTNNLLDRETQEKYDLTVYVRDSGNPFLDQTTTLTICVRDINDNGPIFQGDIAIQISVAENFTVGDEILVVTATDADNIMGDGSCPSEGINSTIHYSLLFVAGSDYSNLFAINNSTGSVVLLDMLDYEVEDSYFFTIQAADRNGMSDGRNSKNTVILTVEPVNDNSPVLSNDSYSIEIRENVVVGTTSRLLEATDADRGSTDGVVRYNGSYMGLVEIDPMSGDIRVIGQLDYEEGRTSFTFTAVAYDGGVPSRSDSATVTVVILDVNDESPVFQNAPYKVYFDEGDYSAADLQTALRVYANDSDGPTNNVVSYSLADTMSGRFRIDNTSGQLFARGLFDVETTESEYNLTVIATDSGMPARSTEATIMVCVNDVNDEDPVLDMTQYNTSIPENYTMERVLFTVSASDPDVDKDTNGRIAFDISGSNAFTVNETTGVVTYTGLIVFDREQPLTQVQFEVHVHDFGTQQRTSTASVTVYIEDINDNPPVFEMGDYSQSVPEDTTPGSLITTISASDADQMLNGNVTYELVNNYGLFGLDLYSGRLTLTNRLDYETPPRTYTLDFIARDRGIRQHNDTASATITVTNTIDSPPSFMNQPYSTLLSESATSGDVVLTISVQDLDASDTVTFTLAGAASSNFAFTTSGPIGYIYEVNITVASGAVFDYEVDPIMYNFQVIATDSNDLNATATVSVSLSDYNDETPMFTRTQFRGEITAGVPNGTDVTNINARDNDRSTSNSVVRYSYASNVTTTVRALFSLNSNSGELKTKAPIVYSPGLTYRFYVVATDSGDPLLSSAAEVLVIVNDNNVGAPMFNQSVYSGSVAENELSGTYVLSVFATDPENDQITYVNISEPNFRLNGNRLLTNVLLDYEDQSQYVFTIRARDNGSLPRYGYAQVIVDIIDKNDHSPVFVGAPYTFPIRENPAVGAIVGTVTATDADSGQNAALTYTSDISSHFAISSDGVITVKNPEALDRETTSLFLFGVTVRDNGDRVMSSSTTVMITLTDEIDFRPIFSEATYTGSIPEGSSSDNLVAAVTVTDRDLNDVVTYNITFGDDPMKKFQIASDGRIFTTSEKLNREVSSSYSLIVTATDSASLMATTTVVVTVTDINDNDPMFTVGPTVTFYHPETSTGPVSIQTFSATDMDVGLNAAIQYSVTSDDSGVFYFNSNQLFARCCVDREDPRFRQGNFAIYTLEVTATDSAVSGQTRSTSIQVTFNVSDINDNSPEFTLDAYSVSISENSEPGEHVVTVSATDPDVGNNAVIFYDLLGSNLFDIDSSSGVVTVASELPEGVTLYQLNVVARDLGTPQRSGMVALNITLLDENDNAPRFSQSIYGPTTLENLPANTIVESVMATDPDPGTIIDYSLLDNFNKFAVSQNGSLFLVDQLNREEQESYTILVVASDDGDDPQFATATVQVTVLDENDESPMFSQTTYSASVPENSRGGVFVAEIKAIDLDAGSNSIVRYVLSGQGSNHFTINQNTGIITVSNSASLDREADDTYVLTINATDSGATPRFSTTTISISITDQNDNAPEFTQTGYSFSVSEDFYMNETRPTPHQVLAHDDDGDTDLTYAILSGNDGVFDINSTTGFILVVGALDRESKEMYSLVITATDSGPSVFFRGTTTVSMRITDVNDNSPIFEKTVYRGQITEGDTVESQFVVAVSAVDADSNDNSVVRYSLVNGTNYFNIDPQLGSIFTRAISFDRETRSSYVIVVEATDMGSSPRTSTVNVIVTVQDINDGQPYFQPAQHQLDVVVPQVAPISISRLVAYDDDDGQNAELDYRISSNPHSLILNDTTPGLIVASSNLESGLAGISYTLTISAVDRGSPRMTGSATIIINFVNNSDSRPRFAQSLYQVSLEENNVNDRLVEFAQIIFVGSLQVTFLGYHPSNLALTSTLRDTNWYANLDQNATFDREERGFYSMTMVATPVSGSSTTPGYATLYLTIEDQNDNSPVFLNEPYSATVVELTIKGSPIGVVVTATDLDIGAFGEVTYAFIQNENETFRIDPNSGEITVNNNVDREVYSSFDLIVEARDGGNRMTVSTVEVTVLDVNDNSPVFSGQFNRTIAEDYPLGEVVVEVTATDEDDGINSRLTYTFEGLGSDNPFSIDSTTGTIRTTRTLDYDSGTTYYDLTVVAADGGSSPRSATTRFRITLTDVNDCIPTFDSPSYTFSISEGITKDSQVGNVPATDCDTGENSRINYRIINGNEDGKFRISNGVILLNETIDFEEFKTFQLTVEAMDNGADVQLSSEAEVTVLILDDNDNAPAFENITLPVRVFEATAPSTVIAFVSARDPDNGENGTVNYRIDQQNVQGVFAIDLTSGDISVISDIDREEREDYWLYIRAYDLGRQSRSSFLNVTIIINDINDNPPTFNGRLSPCNDVQISVEVQENSETGTNVYSAAATDDDIGVNQNLRYSIIGGNAGGVFDITTEGNITILQSPDRESITNSRFTLTIQVADAGTPTLNTLGCLEVVILDCNDFPPQFVNPPSSVSFPECELSSSILTLTATDDDQAGTVNSEISFDFCPGTNYSEFRLQSTSPGVVTLGVFEVLDREMQSTYELCIEAYNAESVAGCTSSTVSQSSQIMVTLNVQDKNDNKPQFNDTTCQATLSEIARVSNETVVTLSAYDLDEPGTSNSALKWIAPVEDNPFHINAGNGVITLRRQLDHETAPQYQLSYEVADSGPEPGTTPSAACPDVAATSTITCTFTIEDENDNAPIFKGAPYTAQVCEEDATVGDFFTVSYSDEDQPPYTDSVFSIVGWTPDENIPEIFTINETTGIVKLNRALDRERHSKYTITLNIGNQEPGVCPDGQTKTCDLVTNGTLTVVLIDVNDNPPTFSSTLLTAEVPSASNPPYNVKTVRADDLDEGSNGQITYSLQEPSLITPGTFSIHNESGEVTLVGSVQEYEGMTFYLTVTAADKSDDACGFRPSSKTSVNVSVTVVGDLQKICLVFNCERNTVLNYKDTIINKVEDITNFTVTGPTFVTNNIGTENCFSAQNPYTNLLVSFDSLEDELFDSFPDLVNIVPNCPLLSIKSPGRPVEVPEVPSILPLAPLFALCGAVSLGSVVVLILASNQRRATRRQRKKEYLGNIFFGTAPTDMDSRGLIQMEQLQQGTDEITHENPVFIEPFQRWQGVDGSREPSAQIGESAVTLTRGNPAYESQEIRMEMFQEGDDNFGEDDDELLAEALKDDSEDEDDILVTAI